MAAKCLWKLCFSVCFTLNFVTTSVVRSRKLFPLDLIHYNDFHDRFEETSVQFPICMSNDTNCIGGFPRLFHEIKELHAEKPQALILNAGDSFQGTYWYTLLKWNVTQHFMNMIPHDAYTLGNHEFDNGIEGLAPYLRALKAPVVVANMNATNEPDLKDLYKPFVVISRGDKLIGIIGVITPDTKKTSKTGNMEFSDPITAVRETAQTLTDQGVNIIIVLSHCGIEVDQKIANEAGENIDIIVGGHTHSLLWNDEVSPSHEQITGPYPMMVGTKNRRGHVVRNRQILIVTAASYSKYIGNLTAYFDDEGELITYDGGPIFLDRSIPEDPEVKALMRPYTEYLHMIVNKVVATSEVDLPDQPCAAGECLIGDIIADSMLDAANATELSNLPTVAFLPRNMIRGGISKGDITRGAIINTLPFGNKVVSVTLNGKYLMEALNKCLESVWTTKPFTGPFLPQVAGMKLVINGKKRYVESVHIKHEDGYKLLKSDQVYRLVTVDFLENGGNGFKQSCLCVVETCRSETCTRCSPLCPCGYGVDSRAQNQVVGFIEAQRNIADLTADIDMICRAHQLVMEGYKWHFNETVLTVWSAPNYCYRPKDPATIYDLLAWEKLNMGEI